MSEIGLEHDPLGELAEGFLERYRRGERPALSEYIRRYPDLAERIEDLFPALVMLEEVRPDTGPPASRLEPSGVGEPLERLGEYRIVRRIGRGGMGIVYEAEQESLGRRVALKVLPTESLRNPHQIERFRREARAAARLHHTNIVPVFGVGQDGETLFYVMQYIEGRPLDLILDELRQIRDEAESQARSRGSAGLREKLRGSRSKPRDHAPPPAPPVPTNVARSLWEGRFRTGSQSAGTEPLDHGAAPGDGPGMDPAPPAPAALTGGSAGSLGGSSSGSLSDPRKPYAWSVAHVGCQVADALEYAVGQGILHRDIKPSNLLLDMTGTVWLTDFGLAKTSGSADLTHTGDLLGTLRYLAPERFQGRTDIRGDIYALGLTLYEMLALRPAFADQGEERLIRQVTSGDPPRLETIDSELPRDIVTIIHKAIARDPCDRYQTPGALAEDLRRFLEDRPIVARQTGAIERGWRWCRRNPGIAVSAASATLALTAAAFLALLYANSQAKATAKITGLAHQISRSLNDSNHRLAVLDLERGQLACERGEIDRGLLLMVESLRAATAVNDPALRHAARANLSAWSRYHPKLSGTFAHAGIVMKVAFSPDGRHFVTACSNGRVEFRDTDTGRLTGVTLAHSGAVRTLIFSPDGTRLLTQSQSQDQSQTGDVRIWNVATGLPAAPPLSYQGFVEAVAFSPDGKTVLTGSEDKTARLWEVATGRLAIPPLPHPGVVRAVAFSPDGKTILTGSQDGSARLWDSATGRSTGALLRHQGAIDVVAFSPDGRIALTAGQDNTTRLWDTKSGQPIGSPLRHQNWVEAAIFSPDGKTVLTGSQDSTARLWDARSSDPICLPLLHQGPVRTLAFSPDGRTALTGSQDGSARLWDSATGQPAGLLLRHQGPIETVAFSPDGKAVLTGSQDRTARLWDTTVKEPVGLPLQHQGPVRTVAFSPDGKTVLTGSSDGTARLWDVATGRPAGPPLSHQSPIATAVFSPDGTTILTGAEDGTAQLWKVATATPLGAPLQHQGPVRAVAFSPDGATVLTGSQDRAGRLWDVATGQPIAPPLYHQGPVVAVAFGPDGETVLTGSEDHTARLWDVATGQPVGRPLLHQRWVMAVAFSPDGKTVLTGSDDTTARLWNAATTHPVGPALRHQTWVRAVAFSPDGKTVVTGSDDTTARLWNATTAQPVGPPLRHEGLVRSVAFSPDGARIVTGGWDGAARLWDAATGRPIGPPLRHRKWVEAVAFSPDGKTVVTGSQDNTARLWRVEELPDDLSRIEASIRAMTGLEIDGQGGISLTDDATWRRAQEQLKAADGSSETTAERRHDPMLSVPAAATGPEIDSQSGAYPTAGADADRRHDPILLGPDPTAPARSWIERKWWDKAEAAFGKAIAAQPLNASIWVERARFLASRQRPDEADADFVQAYLLGSRTPELIEELCSRDHAFRRLVALQPDLAPELWRKRGAHFVQEKRWAKAEPIFTEALTAYPDDPWLRIGRGRVRIALGRPEPAAADFARATPPASASPNAYRNLIGEFARQSLWEKTALTCAKLIELDPSDHETWYFSTPLYLQLNDLPGYQRHCARMLERFGETADATIAERTAKACLLAPLPEADRIRARQLARRAVMAAEGQGFSLLPYCRLAMTLADYRSDHLENALAESERCLAQSVGTWNCDIPAQLVRAMSHARLGQDELARATMDKVADLFKARLSNFDLRTGWHDWLICTLLQREAATLIPNAIVPTDPLATVKSTGRRRVEGVSP